MGHGFASTVASHAANCRIAKIHTTDPPRSAYTPETAEPEAPTPEREGGGQAGVVGGGGHGRGAGSEGREGETDEGDSVGEGGGKEAPCAQNGVL
eukprot:COSAG02_NODE_13522_length_1383_cov_2.938596_1_plen_94_part_01